MDINEIARLAGVSRTTVSRYLNSGYVSKEKRARISSVIQETGYVPSRQAQQLRTGKTGLAGIVIPKINSQSVGRMVAGINDELASKGYQAVLANAENDERAEIEHLKMFVRRHHVDGIILIATVFTPEHLKVIRDLKVPIVILGQQLDGYPCVFQDDYNAVRDVCRIVLRTAKQPAFLGVFERDEAAGHDRHRGFLDACAEAGLKPQKEAQVVVDFDADSGFFGAEKILDAVPDVDTIVCATDDIAFGAMSCMQEYGKRVPDDIQITGFGDSMLSRIVRPSLTTAHLSYKTSGVEAARLLLTRMHEPKDNPPRSIKMPYKVYSRMSTR